MDSDAAAIPWPLGGTLTQKSKDAMPLGFLKPTPPRCSSTERRVATEKTVKFAPFAFAGAFRVGSDEAYLCYGIEARHDKEFKVEPASWLPSRPCKLGKNLG